MCCPRIACVFFSLISSGWTMRTKSTPWFSRRAVNQRPSSTPNWWLMDAVYSSPPSICPPMSLSGVSSMLPACAGRLSLPMSGSYTPVHLMSHSRRIHAVPRPSLPWVRSYAASRGCFLRDFYCPPVVMPDIVNAIFFKTATCIRTNAT